MTFIDKENKFVRPRVLVLLASYNGEVWIIEQLKSILTQKDIDVHILIGDDASKDNTLGLLKENFFDDSLVQVIVWPDSSGTAGSNFKRLYLAANVENYDFIALADQDDIWLEEKLITAISHLNETSSDGYSGAVEAFWPDGRRKILRQESKITHADFLFEGAGQGCTFVMRKQFFLLIQKFCKEHPVIVASLHYHDWLIYLLARAWKKEWYFDSVPFMLYRQHDGNEIGARGSIAAVKKRIKLIRSGWYDRQIQAAFIIYLKANGGDEIALNIGELIHRRSFFFMRKAQLSFKLLRHGRRRFIDRMILVFAAVMGWL